MIPATFFLAVLYLRQRPDLCVFCDVCANVTTRACIINIEEKNRNMTKNESVFLPYRAENSLSFLFFKVWLYRGEKE